MFFSSISRLPASLGGSQGNALQSCISRRFWRHEFAPPLDNLKAFPLTRLNFFTDSPQSRGAPNGAKMRGACSGRLGVKCSSIQSILRSLSPAWIKPWIFPGTRSLPQGTNSWETIPSLKIFHGPLWQLFKNKSCSISCVRAWKKEAGKS